MGSYTHPDLVRRLLLSKKLNYDIAELVRLLERTQRSETNEID